MEKWCTVSYHCPICGKIHGVSRERRIGRGPDRAGTAAELYPAGNLPWSLADLMHDSLVCETTGQYV